MCNNDMTQEIGNRECLKSSMTLYSPRFRTRSKLVKLKTILSAWDNNKTYCHKRVWNFRLVLKGQKMRSLLMPRVLRKIFGPVRVNSGLRIKFYHNARTDIDHQLTGQCIKICENLLGVWNWHHLQESGIVRQPKGVPREHDEERV